MIQLLGIAMTMKDSGQTGKIAAKEGEHNASFDALFQLIEQAAEENPESPGLVNPLPFQQQNPLLVPLLKHSAHPPAAREQGEPIVANQSWNAPVPESLNNGPKTSAVKIGPDAAAIFQVTNSAGAAKEEMVSSVNRAGAAKEEIVSGIIGAGAATEEMVTGFIQKDTVQNEAPNTVQTNKNSPIELFAMANSTPANQPTASEKAVPAPTVNAGRFDQEVKKFLISSINVAGIGNGMEAAFTLAPKHLGKVDVKVTIQDGQVTAEFLTSTPLGKDLLETHIQSLRSALETQGLLVGKIDISQQSTTASNLLGQFSQKGDSQTKQGQQDSRKRGEQPLHKAQDEYRDYVYETGWVSKINTTA